MKFPNPKTHIRLREPTFFIMLSLFPGAKHGYAIMKDVEALSKSKVLLSTGTLYEALARLLEQGLIERLEAVEADASEGDEKSGGPGKPRKIYRLTSSGRQVITQEVEHLETLVTTARLRMEQEWIKPFGL